MVQANAPHVMGNTGSRHSLAKGQNVPIASLMVDALFAVEVGRLQNGSTIKPFRITPITRIAQVARAKGGGD